MNISEKALAIKESSTLATMAKAKAMNAQGLNIISFAVGEPDFDTPDHIKNAAIKAIESGFTKYTPSSGTPELRAAICKKLKDENGLVYEPSQIVVSNGAKHSLHNAFSALLNEGDEVIIPAPFWLSYAEMVRVVGGVPVVVQTNMEDGYKITKQQLTDALTPKTKAILINSPSNPTGMVYEREELQMIADFAVAHDLYVVSDEIYEKIIYDEGVSHVSIASLGKEIFDKTIVINGFSKSYAMTGWRLGYTASNQELAKVMGNLQSHQTSNPNSIAQKAAVEALNGDQSALSMMCEEFKKRRNYVYERMNKMPHIRLLKPEGAFYVFVDVSALLEHIVGDVKIENTDRLADIILEECRVALVSCADFGSQKHLRLSYATSLTDIEEGLNRLETFLKTI